MCQIVFYEFEISELANWSFPSNSSGETIALCRDTFPIHQRVLLSTAFTLMHFERASATTKIGGHSFCFARYKFYLDAFAGRAPVVSLKDIRRSLFAAEPT